MSNSLDKCYLVEQFKLLCNEVTIQAFFTQTQYQNKGTEWYNKEGRDMNTENEEHRALIARLTTILCVPIKNILRIYEACDCHNDIIFSFLKSTQREWGF